MTENVPAVRQPEPNVPAKAQDPDSWIPVMGSVIKLAEHVSSTEFVPSSLRGKPAAVAAAILAGRELELPPMASMQGIHVIEGKPGLSAEMMRALVLAAGHEITFVKMSGAECVIKGRRRGTTDWTTVEWSTDMARAAGLYEKKGSNWNRYPRAQLIARATTELCRLVFADVIHGFRSTEELEDLDEVDGPGGTTVAAEQVTSTVKRRGRRTTTGDAKAAGNRGPAESRDEGADFVPLPGEPGYDEPVQSPAPSGHAAQAPSSGDAGASTPSASPESEGDAGDAGPAEVVVEATDVEQSPASPDEPADVVDAEVVEDEEDRRPISAAQLGKLHARLTELELGGDANRDERNRVLSTLVNRPVESTRKLLLQETRTLLDTLDRVPSRADLDAMVDMINERVGGDQ